MFDEVWVGGLTRHQQTERGVARAYAEAGLAWPSAERDEGWNEYDAEAILTRLGSKLAASDASFERLRAEFSARRDAPDRNRYFQRMFEVLMGRWAAGDLLADGVETFAAFHDRVRSARDRVLTGGGSRRVAVFTSGGPIGICVQLALEAPRHVAMQVNWRVKNASVAEFVFGSGGRLSLDAFNALPHLDDVALHSFR